MFDHNVEATEAVNSVTEREIYAQMLINEKPIKFYIDCGANVNVLPAKYVNKEDIHPTKRVLKMWNKTEVKPEGTCHVTIRNPRNRKKYPVEFIVVEQDLTPLLGAKVIQQMGLIEVHEENFEKVATTKAEDKKTQTAQEIVDKYKDVFEGELGTLSGHNTLMLTPQCHQILPPRDVCPLPLNQSSRQSLRD